MRRFTVVLLAFVLVLSVMFTSCITIKQPAITDGFDNVDEDDKEDNDDKENSDTDSDDTDETDDKTSDKQEDDNEPAKADTEEDAEPVDSGENKSDKAGSKLNKKDGDKKDEESSSYSQTPYEILCDYVFENGEYNDSGYYEIKRLEEESNGISSITLAYSDDSDTLAVMYVIIDDDTKFACGMEIPEQCGEDVYVQISAESEGGDLEASLRFLPESYSSNEYDFEVVESSRYDMDDESVELVASILLTTTLEKFESLLGQEMKDCGVTMMDLGFGEYEDL